MRKAYAIADFLSEENKNLMRKAASSSGFEMTFFDTAREAAGKVSDAEVLYCDDYTTLIRKMPNLKWCHTAYAGIGQFAASGIFDSGEVMLTNSSGAYGRTISEHIIMVSLMLLRRMPEYTQIIDERKWEQDLSIRSIAGSRVVILGTGDIGSAAAEKFKALGAYSVIGFNRSGVKRNPFDEVHPFSEFDEVFSDRDFADKVDLLVICVPGTVESEGMMSKERLALLSERAYLINIGRGKLIDQDALIDALNEGRLAGAALDVMYPEPLPNDHPLWDAPGCIITPHISGNMGLQYTVNKTVELFCDNLLRMSSGEQLINLIDIKRGY